MKTNLYSLGKDFAQIFFPTRSKFLFLLLACFFFAAEETYSQTTAFSFTQIPTSAADLSPRPGRGTEWWNREYKFPEAGSAADAYVRYKWNDFENGQGQYIFTKFDNDMQNAISNGRKMGFGIMTCFPGNGVGDNTISYDGGTSVYPLYLHQLMQGESVKDWKTNGSGSNTGPTDGSGYWVPNYNSPIYLARLLALHQAIYAHIVERGWKDKINYIDVRGYGSTGEWHHAYAVSNMNQFPTGTRATDATLRRIIDTHVEGFPDIQLVAMLHTFDCNTFSNTMVSPAVAYHALTVRNQRGLLGWRRDNWGDGATYYTGITQGNTNVVNGMRLDTAIMNRYKYAPVVGEPCCAAGTGYANLEGQVRLFHVASFGNSNYDGGADAANVVAASKAAGYRITLEGGSLSAPNITTGTPVSVTLNWRNVGIAPTYDDWSVVFQLKNASNQVVWSQTSSMTMRLFSPAATAFQKTDALLVPTSVPAGSYTLSVIIRDPNNYRQPLPLAINGRNSDGSYNLRSLTVTAGGSTPANTPPVARAGQDQSASLPLALATLDGSASSDPDGSIASSQWQQIGGPTTILSSLTSILTTITGILLPGQYSYRLTVTDNLGATASDTVNINVSGLTNTAPTANAGSNQTITLPANSVTLSGSASSDADGTIAGYTWAQVSGPNTATFSSTTAASITASGLVAGSYVFRLTVRDDDNATGTTTVTVTVNPAVNIPPVANAGGNQTIILPTNSATLNGTASSDADGTIAGYTWSQVSGPNTATFSSTTAATVTVSGQIAGTYTYRLTVRDNNNATGTTTVTVTVNAAGNASPVANAGGNQTITLPANSVVMSGTASTDADGTIAGYTWSQVSGPNTATFSSTTTASVTASGLVAGSYVFRLTVRDNNNATGTTTVTVTVNAAANIPPVANAGANQTITLPLNSATLNGGGSTDADGTIAGYTWGQVSGPNTATYASTSTTPSVIVNGLIAGVYTFRLTVRDNNNATATATVTVTVNAAANIPPVASTAGTILAITLPTNVVRLMGEASSDADGTITNHTWAQVSGPNTATLSATSAININASNLIAGTYVFRLTVRDNNNATGTTTVSVVVSPATTVNIPPVANTTGTIQSITLPTNVVRLMGEASSDADGTIAAYTWSQVSGPNTATLSATSAININASGLIAGAYVFRLTVRDNNNATGTTTVTVVVNPAAAANVPPVANAGSNQMIILPTSTATLNGTASYDTDGVISSYQWTQVSGPAISTLSSSTTAAVTASNLRAGNYVYLLTVRDNNNATDTATVRVSVVDNFHSSGSALWLYPNPTYGNLNVVFRNYASGTVIITIYDSKRGVVMPGIQVNKPLGFYTTRIDVSRLTPGSYILEATMGKYTKMVSKFIKR
jgi:hypothetical protein